MHPRALGLRAVPDVAIGPSEGTGDARQGTDGTADTWTRQRGYPSRAVLDQPRASTARRSKYRAFNSSEASCVVPMSLANVAVRSFARIVPVDPEIPGHAV